MRARKDTGAGPVPPGLAASLPHRCARSRSAPNELSGQGWVMGCRSAGCLPQQAVLPNELNGASWLTSCRSPRPPRCLR